MLEEGFALGAANVADLPLKAASLTEAADRHPRHIKPASWAPTSYSAAVGPASFWADVVTPVEGNICQLDQLLIFRTSAVFLQQGCYGHLATRRP